MSTSNCTPCSDPSPSTGAPTIVEAGKYASVLDLLNKHEALKSRPNSILHCRSFGTRPVVWADGSDNHRIRLDLAGDPDQGVSHLVGTDSDGRLQAFYPANSGGRKILISQSGDMFWENQGEANKWFAQGVIGGPGNQCSLALAAFAGCDGNGNLQLVKLPPQNCGYIRPNGQISHPTPAGCLMMFAGTQNALPEGWLLCDGSIVSPTDYPDLYQVIGFNYGRSGSNFYLPDFRGMFPRGVDPIGKNDPDYLYRVESNPGSNVGENPGSKQADAFQCHEHGGGAVTVTTGNTTVGAGGSKKITYVTAVVSAGQTDGEKDGGCGEPKTAMETRPRNLSVNFIISTGC